MAKEYIGRIEALDACYNGWNMDAATIEAITVNIGRIPAADVVEVRHGTWYATDAYPHNIYCSKCYKIFAQKHWEIWQDGSLPRDFCPNCGAKLDGGQDDV